MGSPGGRSTTGTAPLGIAVDVDGAVGLSALQHPLRTLRSRFGPARDQRSVSGFGGVVRLVAREYPDAPVVYLTAAPRPWVPALRRALRMDGYPPGALRSSARAHGTWRAGGGRHKRDVLREVLADPGRQWLLLGDDTGPDPALFAHAAAYGRVAAVVLWLLRRSPDPGLLDRVRERVGQVPVVAAPVADALVAQVGALLGRRGGQVTDWFLTAAERGNPVTGLPAWTEGNAVRALSHGRPYLTTLQHAVDATGDGDLVLLTGWRADAEQRLDDTPAGEVLAAAGRRGAVVRGLLWRSHSPLLGYTSAQHRAFARAVAGGGGRVLLDHRVPPVGSHHQKAVVVRYRHTPAQDVAYVGGIDIAVSRRDDVDHRGDPCTRPFAAVYGPRPAWHDVQVALTGPAVGDVETTLRERWADRAPLVRAPWRVLADAGLPRRPDPLPPARPAPPRAGSAAVQVLRTYPRRTRPLPYAPAGERSVARAYAKALLRAQRLVYVEDQYLWSEDVARVFAAALHRAPRLHLIVVVPRHPDQESPVEVPAAALGQGTAMDLVRRVGGDRVQVLDLEREDGTPIYVHAKLCVVDDVWAAVGSANLNRRSWTHDSELVVGVLDDARDTRAPLDPAGLGDGARRFARDLRLALLREHLGRGPDEDADLLDPDDVAGAVRSAAAALDAWHASGRAGPRPPGRLRSHPDAPVPARWARRATSAFYRTVFDPDGRPLGMRLRRTF
ncbi:MAG TPA: phosphatase domain-containing protein [Actinomycetaceae bacterium]|nr:phosphatase domain-containing protein [Actinomycetaceae bacterium]